MDSGTTTTGGGGNERVFSAWDAARQYGCDMSMIEQSLRMTPAERLQAHSHARETVSLLRSSMEKKLAGH